MSSSYCRKPDYRTQTANIPDGTTEDYWLECYVNGDLTWFANSSKQNGVLLYSTTIHASVDASRGCWVGFIPQGSYRNITAPNFYYKCVE